MIETYLLEENKNLVLDAKDLKAWKKQCEDLGLDMQLNLTKNEGSPVPFQFMNIVMERVYETICPMKVDYKKFGVMPIPLEILSLIGLSEKEAYFDSLEVWYSDKDPDPIVVGKLKVTNKEQKYILGRWGDELCNFEELKKRAIKILSGLSIIKLQKIVNECNTKISNLDTNVNLYMQGENSIYEVSSYF